MSLDVFQQVFSLSLASNAVNDLKGTQTSLQKTLQATLQLLLPVLGWELAWGPVIWKSKPEDDTTGPDNSLYIAYHPALQYEDGSEHPTYVVAIAGTPVESEYVWINQNFAVDDLVDFNAWVAGGITNAPAVVPGRQIVPGTPYLAKGTALATHLLVTVLSPEGAAAPGTTLVDFLSGVDRSDETGFVTTGHSLGGALSPSLALALVSSGVLPADSTLTYPTAGPSPGNRALAELFYASFPARKTGSSKSYQGWNLNLVNTLDIVPQAWAVHRMVSPVQNLFNIPPMYGKPVIPLVQGITFLISQVLPSAPPATLEEFLAIAGPQHGQAYFDEVGIVLPEKDRSAALRAGLVEKSTNEVRLNYPIIAGYEWALEHPKEIAEEIERVQSNEEAKDITTQALLEFDVLGK